MSISSASSYQVSSPLPLVRYQSAMPKERTDTSDPSTAAASSRLPVSDTRESASPEADTATQKQKEAREQALIQQQIQHLASRDREVRNHERAHAAIGGQYAGAPRYQYERGPDGVNYAISGEVSISAGGISGDPQASIDKAQQVRRAALAPAEPSAQDRQVAAQAAQMEAQARVELRVQQREEQLALEEESAESSEVSTVNETSRMNTVEGNGVSDNDGRTVQQDDSPFLQPSPSNLQRRLYNSTTDLQPPSLGAIISRYA